MFSQYSWWDFIKVVLALAIPYYAYVLWTYYREDIREWISNRGSSQDAGGPTLVETEEDETESSLFVVNDHRDLPPSMANNSQPPTRQQPAEWLTEPAKASNPAPATSVTPPQEQEPQVMQLQGPAVNEETETMGFALLMQSEHVEEQSVDELRTIAERLSQTEEGLMKPDVISDRPAARLADIINQQRTNPLNDVAFNR